MSKTELTRLRGLVKNLQTLLPNITAQVDDVNFKCNQVKTVEPVKTSNVTAYVVVPKDYNVYIQSCYQIKPDTSNLKTNKVSITPLSILDFNWGNAYGSPYSPASYVQTKDFSFNEDFNCLASSNSLESGYGLIKNINKKYIDIDIQGKACKLNLGACSRMDSTDQLPKVGQRIYYRGQRTSKTDINLYKGSCV